MAFNFNWSPLIADTERVRDMLTNALNKSPKPPIIVDDIIVNELNLGSTPPELEILEIGDLAEDRFRGIFKMSYTGDAYLTLKTRVQANPLNTYLSTKPAFASPQPLAANSSLTIPIQITLSDIRLSGFVILVFSKQKGITIVFRNDPLESLKVSSTFDSIPFVRNYLQKTIESQLRVLFMEDLPAIIHRLSLRVFSHEYRIADDEALKKDDKAKVIDASHSPLLEAQWDEHNVEEPDSLDTASETHASFSQKNLIRLAALIESQRTLSLFTPSIPDTVYRAWAATPNREGSSSGTQTPSLRPSVLPRPSSSIHTPGVLSSAASQASDTPSHATRPSMASVASSTTIHSLGTNGASRSRPGKKRKHRVVNLRKNREDKEHSDTVSLASSYEDTVSRSGSGSAESSSMARRALDPDLLRTPALSVLREGEISTPPRSPPKRVIFHHDDVDENPAIPRPSTPKNSLFADGTQSGDPTPRPSATNAAPKMSKPDHLPRPRSFPAPSSSSEPQHIRRSSSELRLQNFVTAFSETSGGGILEQAWMMKMATEIARKVEEEKGKTRRWQPSSEDGATEGLDAPPAYVS